MRESRKELQILRVMVPSRSSVDEGKIISSMQKQQKEKEIETDEHPEPEDSEDNFEFDSGEVFLI